MSRKQSAIRIARLTLWTLFTLLVVSHQVDSSSPQLNRMDGRAYRWIDNESADSHIIVKRQSQQQQDDIVTLGATDPIAAATQADNLPSVKGNIGGSDMANGDIVQDSNGGDSSQYPWNRNVYINPIASVTGSDPGGWNFLPDTAGFNLNRTLAIPNKFKNESAIMPFYITTNDPSKVKRAIIVWPGKPRDCWKYADLMLNARSVMAQNYAQLGVTNDSVTILAPCFLDEADLSAGAAHQGELVFRKSSWQHGDFAVSPKMKHSISSYDVIDTFSDMLFDRSQYPNLNQIVVAGHSMGGQAAQRYALLKKTKAYDPNVRFWIGNPGSWAWLVDARPYQNASCASNDAYNTWPYGLGGNQTKISAYARKDVLADQKAVIQRYLSRQVGYALALLDVGAGDTHCQAQWQGSNHLDRGSNFVMTFSNSALTGNGKFPPMHTVDFIANVSHQDYPMYSANSSLQRLFSDGLDIRNPDLTDVTNPGDKNHTKGSNTTTHDPKGQKAFATPAHEKLAVGLLAGSFGLLFLSFAALPLIFTPNASGDSEKWDAQSFLSAESRRILVGDKKW